VFLAPSGMALPGREMALGLIGKSIAPLDRMALLAAAAPAKGQSEKTVCSCFSVGSETLAKAIREHNLKSVAEIGAVLGAGTNCGSCVPELKKLLWAAPALSAAE
jgi:assimilatory nitrate reductase catalytic subunit